MHEAGVLHRDIKPSNILIRRADNWPVLIDFGAAKQDFVRYTKSNAPHTHGYAAIEQMEADGELGPWTDFYGLGAVLWRIVAGGQRQQHGELVPVDALSRMTAIFRGQEDPLPSARTLGSGRFSNWVLKAIDKCLELEPTDRPAGCKELLGLLSAPNKEEPALMTPSSRKGVDATARVELGKPNQQANRSSLSVSSVRRRMGTPAKLLLSLLLSGGVWLGLERFQHQREYYTLGSHQEDVVRIQGPPDRVGDYSDGTGSIKEWYYGNDSVGFKNSQVVEWKNYDGSLSVGADTRSNATRNTYFTLQSHQDDVARLNGTPDEILLPFPQYPGDKMLWIYGTGQL